MSPAEFEAILRESQSLLRAYIAGMGVPLDTVDDLAQDVYLEFYQKGHRRPSDVEPIRWLKGIARNLCLNYFRRSKRKAERELEGLAELLERLPEALETAPDPGPLETCLERLSRRAREMIALRYQDGLESSEIGRKVGLSAEAVRVSLLRIRFALRDCLERRPAEEAGG